MSRPLRIEYEGAFYHVVQRGLERRRIFLGDRDYEKLLEYFFLAHKSYGIVIHAYCLMPNHYHVIIETPQANLKQAMHLINTGYSIYFNKKRRRVGPLFQGRYKSLLIEADEYLDHVSRYIHLNPVQTKTKIAEKPEDYKWSSYRTYVGKERAPGWLMTWFILGKFGSTEKERRVEYEKFVKDVMIDSKKVMDKNTIMGLLIGGKELFVEIKKKYIDTKEDDEIPKIREIKRLDDAEKLEVIKEEAGKMIKREKERKKIMIYLTKHNTGYSLKEIGAFFGGLTYSGVSQVCKRIEMRVHVEKNLRVKLDKLNRKVSNVKT